MARPKKEKQSSEAIEFLLLMKHNNKTYQVPFMMEMETINHFPEVAKGFVLECFSDIVDKIGKKSV